jgi:hypothetical protein
LLRHDIKQLNGARFAHPAQDPFEKSGAKLNPKRPSAKAWANKNGFRLFHGGIMSGGPEHFQAKRKRLATREMGPNKILLRFP